LSNKEIESKLRIFSIDSLREVINGSNKVFLCQMSGKDKENLLSIYKPIQGERPLSDFFIGNLSSRELASYEISKHFGWPNLPPLIIRDGPFGLGSFQKYIDHDPKKNYFNLFNDYQKDLSLIMIFDSIIHNTDRKAGSIILGKKNKIWAIDQALTFNPHTRLRTVMFEFNKMKIQKNILLQIENFVFELESKKNIFCKLSNLISNEEIVNLIERSKILLKNKKIAELDPYSNVPYPLV